MMPTAEKTAETIGTLTNKMKYWLSKGPSPVPRRYLDRYERQQTHHPGEAARRKLAQINPETHIKLLLVRLAMLGEYVEEVLETDIVLFTAEEARTVLSVLNSIPLATQYFCSAVTLRINAAMRHVTNFHADRRRIDKWQRGNVFKRAVWRYKFSKGMRLPAKAALWERGHISRVAVKGSHKMCRLAKKFLKEAWKTRTLSGECAYWMKMMGVEEKRSEKVFYNVEKKEWCTIAEAPVISSSGVENAESEYEEESDSGEEEGEDDEEVEEKAVTEKEEVALTEEEAELPEGQDFQPSTQQRSVLQTVSEVDEEGLEVTLDAASRQVASVSEVIFTSEQNETSSEPTIRDQSRQPKEVGPDDSEPEFPTIRLETIEENREEEDAAEQTYLKDKATRAKAVRARAAARNTKLPSAQTSQPDQRNEEPPDYYHAYFHPRLTDAQICLVYSERTKATVQREQLWNPPPRYLDADSQRMCMDVDSKWRVRAPRMDEGTVLRRRRGEEKARRREKREKYQRETPFLRRCGDTYKAWIDGKAKSVEEVEKEEWVDEKSEAYAHILERTMMFGRGEEGEERSSSESQPLPESRNKEAKSTVIHVQRRISIRHSRLTRPFRTTTKTTIETANHPETRNNSTTFTRAKRTLLIRPRRPRHEQPVPSTPKTFAPTAESLQQFHQAVQKLLKQARRNMLDAHTRTSRFMDVWDKCADSGQAWRSGKDRMAPGFAEGSRGY